MHYKYITDLLIPDADVLDPMNQLEKDDKSTSDGVEELLSNDININARAPDAKKANTESMETEKKA